MRSEELTSTVDDRLRRVGRTRVQTANVEILATGPLARGGRIAPAQPIPVVNMKRERNHLAAQRGITRDRANQLVRGWATRAALRREQLDHDRSGSRSLLQ